MKDTLIEEGARPGLITPTRSFSLQRILVAYDGSLAAERALVDAAVLARRFRSEIIAAHVQSPERTPLDTLTESRRENRNAKTDLKEITDRLNAKGLECHGVVHRGAVGDTLFNLCIEESADLLMLGAYGCGSQDRHTLGSTAEHLLSALPCPAMVYGPSVKFTIDAVERRGPVLLPLSFPSGRGQIDTAINIALYFNVSVEVLHVADTVVSTHRHQLEEECKRIASLLKHAGIESAWSLLYGDPSTVISNRSAKLASPFILMPLKHHRVLASDYVAARVIRESEGPVMTFSVR